MKFDYFLIILLAWCRSVHLILLYCSECVLTHTDPIDYDILPLGMAEYCKQSLAKRHKWFSLAEMQVGNLKCRLEMGVFVNGFVTSCWWWSVTEHFSYCLGRIARTTWGVQCESKIPPCGFLTVFPKRMGIFNQFFTHLLYVHIYSVSKNKKPSCR